MSLDDLKQFRQWGAKAPGHPERGRTAGVEITTGPLGQGLANAVGMAIAEAHLAARYNRDGHEPINHRTWALVSDGDLINPPDGAAKDLQGSDAGGWSYAGRNLHFGVREHAMGAIVNGSTAHGGMLPFGATFFIFSDYLRPAIRLAALMGLHVVYVFTHDSIAVGEDGPTHQPVEQLASLRAIPRLKLIRPADANETAVAWQVAIETRDRPVLLVLTRQALPTLDRSRHASAEGLRRGAYIVRELSPAGRGETEPDLILMASGSELTLILSAAKRLCSDGWAVELRVSLGWHRYVGDAGDVLGLEGFGASAPAGVLLREFGFTVDQVLLRARRLLSGCAA